MADDFPAPARIHYRIQVGGIRYHYWRSGREHAGVTPLVLVHGLGVSGAYWARVQPLLAVHRPVYVVDLPGFGRTSRPTAILDSDGLAGALGDWLAAIGLPRVHLLGHSAGGQVVAAFARRYPARVGRLILLASTIGRRSPQLLPHLPGLLHDLLHERRSLLPVLVQDGLRAGPLRILRTDAAITADDTLATLAGLTMPILVLRGADDTIVSAWETQQILRAAPHAAFVVIPGAPHVPQWSDPRAVAAAVQAFLASAPAD